MNEFAVILAGGSGQRMLSTLPKQFMTIHNKPILLHTISAFLSYSKNISIYLTLPKNHLQYWEEICEKYQFHQPITIVIGGKTRFESVKNTLNAIQQSDGIVAIHDGVRPLVTKNIIKKSFQMASKYGSAVATIPLKDSIREIKNENKSQSLNRKNFRLVQTPQTFNLATIKNAYKKESDYTLTDDASVAERNGMRIKTFDGCYSNIKITTKEDITIAKTLFHQLQ